MTRHVKVEIRQVEGQVEIPTLFVSDDSAPSYRHLSVLAPAALRLTLSPSLSVTP